MTIPQFSSSPATSSMLASAAICPSYATVVLMHVQDFTSTSLA
jgi:hypothetical protein